MEKEEDNGRKEDRNEERMAADGIRPPDFGFGIRRTTIVPRGVSIDFLRLSI
jgi:hypothetical protein